MATLLPATGATAPAQGDRRTVAFRGVNLDVPATWPIYDLSAQPTRCVRFDVHAVYLGHAGPEQRCPTGLVGHAEAVQVEPLDAASVAGMTFGPESAGPKGLPAVTVEGVGAEGSLTTAPIDLKD